MDDIKNDQRFAHISIDPRFRRMKKKDRKVKIDKRFKGMFDDNRFKLKYSVDKRGRPIHVTSKDHLKKYYDMSDSNDDEEEEDNDDNDNDVTKDVIRNKEVKRLKKMLVKHKTDSEDKEDETDEDEEEEDTSKDESEDNEDVIDIDVRNGPDYARGEGNISSSEDEDDDDDDDNNGDKPQLNEDDVDHSWGERDHDAISVDEATYRLAICNMDWDRIKAQDLFVLFNSFKPAGGVIRKVTIYPSEFGLERMSTESRHGPTELVTRTEADLHVDDNDAEYHREKLRIYQLNRLKYYYGVVVCDSSSTANHIYEQCDGLEYEGSSNKIDLRFIPDEMAFEQEPKSEVHDMPDSSTYKPSSYISSALQQSKVNLTWDETDPDRIALTMRKFTADELDNLDVKDYLASDSDPDESYSRLHDSDDEGSEQDNEEGQIQKYHALLQEIQDKEKVEDGGMEMEISWEPGLKETTKDLVRKSKDSKEPTPWEKYLDKSKEKKKKKKKKKNEVREEEGDDDDIHDDDIPDDIDLNDPYFKEELEKMKGSEKGKNRKTKKKKKSKEYTELTVEELKVQKQQEAELALLMSDEDDTKKHFNLKQIQDGEKEVSGKKKRRRRKLKEKMEEDRARKAQSDDFQMNTADDRFHDLYHNPLYNIDPTAPEFKRTKGIDMVIDEKIRRRTRDAKLGYDDNISTSSKKQKLDEPTDCNRTDPSLANLIKSVKAKTKSVQDKKKSHKQRS